MENHIETTIKLPSHFYFDFFNASGKQKVFILFGSNFICMKCGMHQYCVPKIEGGKNITEVIITEYHQPDCEYFEKLL